MNNHENNPPQPAVITIVGGGVWVTEVCEQLSRVLTAESLEIRLTARNNERLAIIANHTARRVVRNKPAWRVVPSVTPDAFVGSQVVVLMLRVGGLQARAVDETFPQEFGLVGDEGLGLGGYANALRTMPVMEKIGEEINRVAADALVLNLVAPLGLTTGVLHKAGLDALGVCELPLVTEERLMQTACFPDDSLVYAGLNHIGWFWNRKGVVDPQATSRLTAARLADQQIVKRFDAMPLEYYYRVYDPESGYRLGVTASPGRAQSLQSTVDDILSCMQQLPGQEIPALGRRKMPWISRALVPILLSVLEGDRWDGFINCINGNLIADLPEESIVELKCYITGKTVHPLPVKTEIPLPVLDFLQAAAEAENLFRKSYDSGGDKALLKAAILSMPIALDEQYLEDMADAVLLSGSMTN